MLLSLTFFFLPNSIFEVSFVDTIFSHLLLLLKFRITYIVWVELHVLGDLGLLCHSLTNTRLSGTCKLNSSLVWKFFLVI